MKSKILIGWSSRDIAPGKSVNLSGQFEMRITRKLKDSLSVTALAVSSGSGKESQFSFIWVSCDVATIPDDVVAISRQKLLKQVEGFPVKNLIVNATHTHTAPDLGIGFYAPVPKGVMTSADYVDFFTDKVVEAAAEAWRCREKGFVSYGIALTPIGHGRRAVYFDDLSKRPGAQEWPGMNTEKNAAMYGDVADDQFDHIEGYADHSAHFLFTYDHERKLTGAVINVACTAQETENLGEMSSDFWRETRCDLREKYGPKLFVLPQSSAAGGLSPHVMLNRKASSRMLKLKGISSRQEIANRIIASFDETLSWASRDMKDSVELKHIAESVSLPRRMISKAEWIKTRKGLLELEAMPPSKDPDKRKRFRADTVMFSRKQRCKRILKRYEEQKKEKSIQTEIHVVRVGDMVFATNAFELFEDYGIRIQARSPAVQTVVVELCGRGTYVPTAKAVEGGGYSACLYCNEVGPEGGNVLVERTLKLIKSIWE